MCYSDELTSTYEVELQVSHSICAQISYLVFHFTFAAGIIISGAGDPTANIGNAKVWIIHAEEDETIAKENADALVAVWNAEYTLYDEWGNSHDCWEKAAGKEDLLGWLLFRS